MKVCNLDGVFDCTDGVVGQSGRVVCGYASVATNSYRRLLQRRRHASIAAVNVMWCASHHDLWLLL